VRVHVESWAPEYGGPVDLAQDLTPDSVDTEVETIDWRPLDGRGELPARVAFVDGVRRVDARLTADNPQTGPVPGICGSCAAGSVIWDSAQRCSQIRDADVRRLAILGDGLRVELPAVSGLVYHSESFPSRETPALIQQLQTRMRQIEGELSTALADEGLFVISDGPIQPLAPHAVVGFIKRQLAPYLEAAQAHVMGQLAPGQRTPLFCFGARYPRYSWYLRLARVVGGHSWSGVARCECTATLPLGQARELADVSALLLPRFASAQHIDPRAPQNLVPIGALEKHLRRLLGDAALVYRSLRSAVAGLEM